MISSFLFRRFFCTSAAASDHLTAQPCFYNKLFQMVRSFFSDQLVMQGFSMMCLHTLLQNGLAIKKELFMLQVIQYEFRNKLFCTSKTTIQVNGPDQCFKCIRCNGRTQPAPALFLAFPKKDIIT